MLECDCRVKVVFIFAWREASLIEGMASDALLKAYLPSGDWPTLTLTWPGVDYFVYEIAWLEMEFWLFYPNVWELPI